MFRSLLQLNLSHCKKVSSLVKKNNVEILKYNMNKTLYNIIVTIKLKALLIHLHAKTHLSAQLIVKYLAIKPSRFLTIDYLLIRPNLCFFIIENECFETVPVWFIKCNIWWKNCQVIETLTKKGLKSTGKGEHNKYQMEMCRSKLHQLGRHQWESSIILCNVYIFLINKPVLVSYIVRRVK